MEYASKGVANAGLTTGIIGTALGVLNGGLGNGLFNNSRSYCGDDQFVTRFESHKDKELAEKDSEIALLKANIFTDQKITDVFERINTRINGIEKTVNENVCSQAVANQRFSDNIGFVDSKFDGVYKTIDNSNREMKSYVDYELSRYVPGKLVMPLSSLCPPAQPLCPCDEPITSKK